MRNTEQYRVDAKEVIDFLKEELKQRIAKNREELSCGDMGPRLLDYTIKYLEEGHYTGPETFANHFDGWLKNTQLIEYGR